MHFWPSGAVQLATSLVAAVQPTPRPCRSEETTEEFYTLKCVKVGARPFRCLTGTRQGVSRMMLFPVRSSGQKVLSPRDTARSWCCWLVLPLPERVLSYPSGAGTLVLLRVCCQELQSYGPKHCHVLVDRESVYSSAPRLPQGSCLAQRPSEH